MSVLIFSGTAVFSVCAVALGATAAALEIAGVSIFYTCFLIFSVAPVVSVYALELSTIAAAVAALQMARAKWHG